MENTGTKDILTLKAVTNDSNQYPLDMNGNLCSQSGLPQDTKNNTSSDPNYIPPSTDLTSCPVRAKAYRVEASSAYCEQVSSVNDGNQGYTTLEQYHIDDGSTTGVTKSNISGDPDYVAPSQNLTACPLPQATVNYSVNQSSIANANLQIKDNGTIVESLIGTGSGTYSMVANDTLAINAYSTADSTGTSPILHLVVLRNGTSVYDNTAVDNNGASLTYSEAAVSGATYTITVTSSATSTTTTSTTTSQAVPNKWIAQQSDAYCETEAVEVTNITNFASPNEVAMSGNYLFYTDPSLNGVIYFDPTVITDGSQASLITIPVTSGSSYSGSRPTGMYHNTINDRLYVNSFYGGGLTVIDCASKAILHTITYGTDASYGRGEVYYVNAVNEIWAIANSILLRINATSEVVNTNTFSGANAAVYIASTSSAIYVFADNTLNNVRVYNNSLVLTATVSNLCENQSSNGQFVSRGYYNDTTNSRILVGEASSTGGVTVFHTDTNTITRVPIPNEGYTYVSVSVIAYHPIRNCIYVGGSLFTTTSDSVARIWLFDTATLSLTQTISPSANDGISSMIYYTPNSSVYAGSAGEIPESSPNTNQLTDGVVFKFN